jgi:hypothetical protein
MLKLISIVFILTFTSSSCFNLLGDPSSSLLKDIPNNNKTKKAVLLQNDGNATVDLSLQVSILDYNYKLSGKEIGNTFTVDRNHTAAVLDSTSIKFNWVSNDTLQIDYDKNLRTFIQEKKVKGVTIIYIER